MPIITNKKNISPVAQLIKNKPDLICPPKEGSLVEVFLIKKTPKAVFFDLKGIGTAVVCGMELFNAKTIIKNLNVGDSVSAKIINPENDDGYIEISLTGAQRQKNWQALKNAKDSDEIITVKITGANSSGLIAEINQIKAFLPVSQLSNENYPRVESGNKGKILEELKKFIGKDLAVKILDVNPKTSKLIISEREVVEENIKELLNQYKVGDVIDGIISGVADFGAFIRFADNPAIEGLIHISELDHRLIDNPKEVVKVDEKVKAKIIEIKDGRVSLSLKALKVDPWEKIGEKFKEKQEVKGVVYKFNPFGAFINLEYDSEGKSSASYGAGLQGLIHVSEFGGVEEMQKQLEIGKKYEFIVDSVKPEEKRIFLKLKKE